MKQGKTGNDKYYAFHFIFYDISKNTRNGRKHKKNGHKLVAFMPKFE